MESDAKRTAVRMVWQPIMLVTQHRMECGACGAKAIFIVLDETKRSPDGGDIEWDYSAWCQDCWRRAQEED